jgi:hypothetical protein
MWEEVEAGSLPGVSASLTVDIVVDDVRLVTDHLMKRLFQPERLAQLLASLSARWANKTQSLNIRSSTSLKSMTGQGKQGPARTGG